MCCPQTMILQISRNFKFLRRRAWDKSPITLTRLNTCNRVKTTNPEYKNTQQDLTGWKLSFPTLKDMQAVKDMWVVNCRFLSNSIKEGGALCKSAKQLQRTSTRVLTFMLYIRTIISCLY